MNEKDETLNILEYICGVACLCFAIAILIVGFTPDSALLYLGIFGSWFFILALFFKSKASKLEKMERKDEQDRQD